MKAAKITLFTAVIILAGCKAESPALTGRPKPPPPVSYAPPKPDPKSTEKFFKFATAEFTAEQPRYDENQITVQFKVSDPDGKSVNGLKQKDFRVQENGIEIPSFKLASETHEVDQVADIAFVVDITGSMGPFIETAKLRLIEFIKSSRQQGYHIRMCLSTFGDFVTRKCDRFYDNTSDDQVQEVISELTQLTIHKGQGEVAPYLDWEENPMRALVETASAPWTSNSQRFAILVTDADFYSPDKPNSKHFQAHQSNPDTAAPAMSEVLQAISSTQMRVFAVTPSKPGYNSDINGQPGIVQASQGGFYKFNNVINGKSLDTILNNILRLINTTYTLTYTVDKVPGLNPTLPKEKRKIEIAAAKGQASVKSVQSSMPDGRPAYQQAWKVSNEAIQRGSTQVFVNDHLMSASEYGVNGGEVNFVKVPAPGSKIRVIYTYEAIEKNLRQEPVWVEGRANPGTMKVYLNGKEARAGEDFTLAPTSDGNTNINLKASVMASNDPFEIRRNNGLKVRVITNL